MALKRYYKTIDGQKWAFLKFGKGRPIFLFHGMLNYADYYGPLAHDLADEFEVIVPDLPGFGYTKRLDVKNSIDEMTKYTASFVDSFSFDKTDFFGASLGGTILLDYALNHGNKINYMFVQSPLWRKGGLKMNSFEKFQLRLARLPSRVIKVAQKEKSLKFIFRWVLLMKPDLRKLLVDYQKNIIESIQLVDVRAAKELFESLMKFDISKRIKQINVRTIVIVGDKDIVIPLKESIDLSKKLKKDITAILKNQDHEMILDAPEKVAEIIRDFALRGKKFQEDDILWKKY